MSNGDSPPEVPPTDSDTMPPMAITPLESGYIRLACTFLLPLINYVLDATNLDVTLHMTKITQSQLNKAVMGLLALGGIVGMVIKRIKDGNNPLSTAPKIVMRKPEG